MKNKITFSFGENWLDYLTNVNNDDIEDEKSDLIHWLNKKNIILAIT